MLLELDKILQSCYIVTVLWGPRCMPHIQVSHTGTESLWPTVPWMAGWCLEGMLAHCQ